MSEDARAREDTWTLHRADARAHLLDFFSSARQKVHCPNESIQIVHVNSGTVLGRRRGAEQDSPENLTSWALEECSAFASGDPWPTLFHVFCDSKHCAVWIGSKEALPEVDPTAYRRSRVEASLLGFLSRVRRGEDDARASTCEIVHGRSGTFVDSRSIEPADTAAYLTQWIMRECSWFVRMSGSTVPEPFHIVYDAVRACIWLDPEKTAFEDEGLLERLTKVLTPEERALLSDLVDRARATKSRHPECPTCTCRRKELS